MKVIGCHNQSCRFRIPIDRATYQKGQYYCSQRCAAGSNPPPNDKAKASEALSRPQLQMPYDFVNLRRGTT